LSFIISLQPGQPALFTKAHTLFSTNSATMKPYGVVHGWASQLQWPSAGSRGLSTWSPVIQLFLWALSCFMLTGFMLTSSWQYTFKNQFWYQVCMLLLVKWDLPARTYSKWNRVWENSHGECELTLQKN
jgi:hypothetical protein